MEPFRSGTYEDHRHCIGYENHQAPFAILEFQRDYSWHI